MTRYQLKINAENLPRGLIRRPNPYAVVTVTGGPRLGETLGKTDVVFNTVDPDFAKTLFLETDSSVFMPIRVAICNDRNDAHLAEANFEATEVHVSRGRMQERLLPKGAKIFVSVEESLRGTSTGTATLQFRGLDLKNVEPGLLGLGRSDPFFEIAKKNSDHASGIVRWSVLYRSKHWNNHLNPLWDKFTLSLEELCHGDLKWPLRLTVLDYGESGKHTTIGSFETTLEVLQSSVAIRGNADRQRAFEIYGESKSGKIETRGLIVVLKVDLALDEPDVVEEQDSSLSSAPAPASVYKPKNSATAPYQPKLSASAPYKP